MKTTKAQQSTKEAKAERRARRSTKQVRRGDRDWEGMAVGGSLDPIILRRTLDAFNAFDPGGPWSVIAPKILPLLKRIHQPFTADSAPIHLHVPPGVWAGFGIDVGPAWAHVSRDLADRWEIDDATLLGAALDNLRRRVVEEPPLVEPANFAGAPATVVQAQGWGSALILAPDRLGPLIGAAPRMLLTPVRNALVALPEDLDMDLAIAIWSAFADGSRDELEIEPLRWTGAAVETLAGFSGGPIH